MHKLAEYEPVVGRQIIDELHLLASKAQSKSVQNINSTAMGGGVAEILNRMVPFLKELGVNAGWDVIKGGEEFFKVTKKFHNALHGWPVEITHDDFQLFMENGRRNSAEMNINADIIFVHDPQPIMLIERKKDLGREWIWRCHVDVSQALESVWNFLMTYINQYDATVFSHPAFAKQMPLPQYMICPSIDPLADKNRDLSREEIDQVLHKLGIKNDKPIVTQISRFDYLKDPVGVIEVYKMVKRYVDCQLILAGGGATDDPEGAQVLKEVEEKAADDPDIHVLLLPGGSDIEINALQRASDVIVQKSIREGFGLTVAEALWKARPVVASAVGGITLQIAHKYSGLLSHTIEGTAYFVKQILNDPEYGQRLGKNGREHVLNNFLLTRHLKEYLLLFLSLGRKEDIVYL